MKYLKYCENPSIEVVKLLIDAGSNVKNVSVYCGKTILHFAVEN